MTHGMVVREVQSQELLDFEMDSDISKADLEKIKTFFFLAHGEFDLPTRHPSGNTEYSIYNLYICMFTEKVLKGHKPSL